MADETNPLVALIETITADRRIAVEVLTKLPRLITESGDVVFNLATPVSVPSLAKIRTEALGTNVNARITAVENLSRGLVQEVDRVIALTGEQNRRTSPFWNALDLRAPDLAGESGDINFRAQVNNSIRLPADAELTVNVKLPLGSTAASMQVNSDWMLPNHVEVSEQRYTGTPSAAPGSQIDVFNYQIAGPNRLQTKVIRTPVYTQYYGYYYRQYNYWNTTTTKTTNTNTTTTKTVKDTYYWWWWANQTSNTSTKKTTTTNTSTKTTFSQSESIDTVNYTYISGYQTDTYDYLVPTYIDLGGSMTAQTFQVPDGTRVLKAVQVLATNMGKRAAAQPKLYLCENSYGRPDLNKIITTGTLLLDAEATSADNTVRTIRFDLKRPVVLGPGRSYSFVIEAIQSFNILFLPPNETTGGVFFTQDRQAWEQDLQKDICYRLVYADFAQNAATFFVPLTDIQLPGGIAAADENLAVEKADDADVTVEVSVNGAWYPIDHLNTIYALPPTTPARLKFTGTRWSYPILDTVNSKINVFRPAQIGRFISYEMEAKQTVTVSYELIGFEPLVHTFDPALLVGTSLAGTRYTPTTQTFSVSPDGMVRTVTAVYNFPLAAKYRHDIKLATINASSTYDIRSVIELNA